MGKGIDTFTSNFTGYAIVCTHPSKNENVINSIQIEEGTTATDYEPYIPSVKMLSDKTTQIKQDLTKHTLKKLTDVSFFATSSGNSIVGTNSIYEETFINNGIVKKSYKIWLDVQSSENTISMDLASNLGSSQELLHSTSIITGYIIDGSGGVYADITGITDSRFYNMYLKFGKELQADDFYDLYFEFNSYTEQ